MKFKISDYCLIIPSVENSVAFYKDTLGLLIRFHNEDFADFELTRGPRLALWDYAHISQVVGAETNSPQGNRSMGAVRMDSPETQNAVNHDYKQRGVNFITEPKIDLYGSYAVYFKDPDL
jgi:catechol 2,3-dioxygenase-like lactoylglutathione lyase family enzyme